MNRQRQTERAVRAFARSKHDLMPKDAAGNLVPVTQEQDADFFALALSRLPRWQQRVLAGESPYLMAVSIKPRRKGGRR